MAAECNVGEFAVNVPVLRWSRASFSDVTGKRRVKRAVEPAEKLASFLEKIQTLKKEKLRSVRI
jgi:hypothetical protein